MSKILIIGGNGFIGSNLSGFLASNGNEVYSFDIVEPKIKNSNVKYIQGDFFDDNTLAKVIKGMDIIYHALSTINPGNSNEKYMMGYGRDFIQTVKLFSMLQNTDTKLVFLSSGGTVYGNQAIQPIRENSTARPINHYGNVKLCIENTLRIFAIQAKSKMIIARISNPYGPGQDYNKGVGFIDAVIKKTLSNETIEIWGDGEVIRDYIYIDDVCKMLWTLANYEGEERIFNVSSCTGTSQNEIIEIVKSIDPNVKFEYKPGRSVDAKRMILDNSLIKTIYDEPIVDVKEGIVLYYKQQKSAVKM